MAAPPASESASAGQQQQVKLKMTKVDDIPFAFRWVMAAASSSSLTIGEKNKNNFCPSGAWIPLVSMPSVCIPVSAASAYTMYGESFRGPGFPWYVPVVMLWGVYMAVLNLAMWHLTLFLPEAPYASREALRHVGLEKIGIPLTLTSGLVLVFDLTCMLWSCLVAVLIAAVLAFWIVLIRMYGSSESKGELARVLALSSIMTAAMVVWFIRLVSMPAAAGE